MKCGLMVVLLATSLTLNAAKPVQATSSEHVDFAPGGTIRINGSAGFLNVEGWDQPQVEISIVKSLGYDPDHPERLEGVQVATARKSGSELTITTTGHTHRNRLTHPLSNDVVVDYRLRVPRNSHLIIEHSSGYVSVTGVTGDVEAADRRGDIVLMVPDLAAYSIDAKTKAGVVTSDLDGTTHRHLLGERFIRDAAGASHRIQLRMGFGGIAIQEMPKESLAPAPTAGN